VKLSVESSSARETKGWGRRLASCLKGGELLGLSGEIGAGKTCFVKGLARGLDLNEGEILSPTFTMIQEHKGLFNLYHIDLYRLDDACLDDMGLREYLFSDGIAAVEWFERLRESSEVECLLIRIRFAAAGRRTIEFESRAQRYDDVIKYLRGLSRPTRSVASSSKATGARRKGL
jgi:tRNA threonylcarbamoyladenosine biosynthesis protein TsaE